MKSTPSIWQYVVSVKSTVKISSNFVALLENLSFNHGIFLDVTKSMWLAFDLPLDWGALTYLMI